MTLSDAQIATAARTAGFKGTGVVTAVAVALAESGGNPDATHHNSNGSTDYGLWQINSVHGALLHTGSWRDPVANARMAFVVSNGGRNWSPWSTYSNGSYARFVGRARKTAGAAASPLPSSIGGGASASGGAGVTPPASSSGGTSLTDGHTWLRVAMFLAGLVILVIALFGIAGRELPVKKLLKVAA